MKKIRGGDVFETFLFKKIYQNQSGPKVYRLCLYIDYIFLAAIKVTFIK